MSVLRLPVEPDLCPEPIRRQLVHDYEVLADSPDERPWESLLLERYGLDVGTAYGGFPIRNPWGKASGQLSLNVRQVAEDVDAGLGFVVLKTLIAEDAQGGQSMEAWAIRESRMVVERINGTDVNSTPGWTVTWKGRGWWQSLDDYLQLLRESRVVAQTQSLAGLSTLIVPSCKYHIPAPGEAGWRTEEYEFTTQRLLSGWGAGPMPLEKDFSPTLAGSDRANAQSKILEWLERVPSLIRSAGEGRVRIGLKLFNALFDDSFQVEMLQAVHRAEASRPDYFVYGNRLFNPAREIDGLRGVAYGGPDLSDRNLRVLDQFAAATASSGIAPLPWCATGNITTGKMALEYALRGAECFQLHTFFQLPLDEYRRRTGNRTARALHELWLHPNTGLVVWMHHLAAKREWPRGLIRFHDVIGQALRL